MISSASRKERRALCRKDGGHGWKAGWHFYRVPAPRIGTMTIWVPQYDVNGDPDGFKPQVVDANRAERRNYAKAERKAHRAKRAEWSARGRA